MEITIKKWGNSPSVRIPNAIMRALHLHVNQALNIRQEKNSIILEPIQAEKTYELDTLIASITTDNMHSLIDTGAPVGNEIW